MPFVAGEFCKRDADKGGEEDGLPGSMVPGEQMLASGPCSASLPKGDVFTKQHAQ